MPNASPIVIGHRGAPGYLPEHTRSCFALAIAQGADAVEVDLVPSKDGELVVRHENELSGTTDVAARPEFASRFTVREVAGRTMRGWFAEDFTWAELATLRARERLPRIRRSSAAHDGAEGLLRLADVLAMTREAGVRIVVELKHAGTFDAAGLPLDELLLAAVPAGTRGDVVVESFEHPVLRSLAARGWDAPLVYLMMVRGGAPSGSLSYRAERADFGAFADLAGISVPVGLVGPGLVERAATFGLDVWTWTLRPENVFLPPKYWLPGGPARFGRYEPYWRALAAAGVAGVFADHPDLARRTFAQDSAAV